MSEFVPSKEDRDKALRHIRYERNMMLNARHRLLTKEYRDCIEMNMLIETCMLHARNLRFFLVGKQPDRKQRDNGGYDRKAFDIVAEDYFSDRHRENEPPKRSVLLDSLDYSAGKFLAHPSYKRDSDPKPDARFLSCVVDEIIDRLAWFRANANNDVDWTRFDTP